jgi:hypothetical protein
MDEQTCLTKTKHEQIEYSHTADREDVFVCKCCGKEFTEKVDSCG